MPRNPCDPAARRRARHSQPAWPMCRINRRPESSPAGGRWIVSVTDGKADGLGAAWPAPPAAVSPAEDVMRRRIADMHAEMRQRLDLITSGASRNGFPPQIVFIEDETAQLLAAARRRGPLRKTYRQAKDIAQQGRGARIYLYLTLGHTPGTSRPRHLARRVMDRVLAVLAGRRPGNRATP